jgi:hypothetical protein
MKSVNRIIKEWMVESDSDKLLDLSNLGLSKFPAILSKIGVKKLNCSNNRLTLIPSLNVEELYISNNVLKTLPKLPNIVKLNCSHNNISILPKLPETLTFLICSYNPLRTIVNSVSISNLEKIDVYETLIPIAEIQFIFGQKSSLSRDLKMLSDEKKINVILDLDNTLISSAQMSKSELERNRRLRFIDMKPYFRVYTRPYLQEFLDYVFKNFNVSIWTASSKDYAVFISLNIVEQRRDYEENYIMLDRPERKVKVLLYSINCDESQHYYSPDSPKDLRYLFDNIKIFNPCNTIIIDDLGEVSDVNPQNTIRAEKFEYNDAKAKDDIFLLKAMEILSVQKKLFEMNGCVRLLQ